jgi:hypothetical protein
MNIPKFVLCSMASGYCAVGAFLWAAGAVKELRQEDEWSRVIAEDKYRTEQARLNEAMPERENVRETE